MFSKNKKLGKDKEPDSKANTEKPLKQDSARYFGGHLKYPLKSPGILTPGDSKTGIMGTLKLFDDRIEFEKSALRESKRIKIVIPFSAIDLENVQFAEKDSGRSVALGGGMAGPGLVGPVGVGGGFLSSMGELVLLTIPYIDENGIKHAPRFLVKGVIRDKTQEWAQILYDKLVELRGKLDRDTKKSDEVDIVEKLRMLKNLYESGILSEEEYKQKKMELLEKL